MSNYNWQNKNERANIARSHTDEMYRKFGEKIKDCIDKTKIYNTTFSLNKDTVGQYTGLKDKNGNKLFENDIVEFLGKNGLIKIICGSFGIVFNDTNDYFISLWEIYWNRNEEEFELGLVKKLGNIYDNSELLEANK